MQAQVLQINYPIFFLALLLWVANALLHLEFSYWIIASYPTPFGDIVPRDYSPHASVFAIAALVFYIGFKIAKGKNELLSSFYFLCWFIAALLVYKNLMTTELEAIHYLQYGILAYLFAIAVDGRRQKWCIASLSFLLLLLSICDEINQYVFLAPSNGNYVDFNDFVLNQIGISWGLLLYYGFRSPIKKEIIHDSLMKPLVVVFAGLLLIVAALSLMDIIRYMPQASTVVEPGGFEKVGGLWRFYLQREPNLFNNWLPSFSGERYFVMGPLFGFASILTVIIATASFKRVSQKFAG